MSNFLRELRFPGAPLLFWLLLFLTFTTPFWDLGRPLLEVDDARYAEVPREMIASGDWATPHLNELDYVEKPPLWYWLCAASYKVFGVSEAAARLPLACLAVLGLLGTAWLGAWLFEARVGWTAAIMLGTSGLYFALGHFITPDMGLTVWLLWCSAFLLRALLRPQDAGWAAPAAWACSGLAFLSKGLVGILFPALWAASLALLFPEVQTRWRGLLRPAGPALFLLIAAPWFILMEHRHPGFLRFFFYEHHILRFATQKFHRSNPWYFFLALLPAGLLPWTPIVAAGIGRALADWRRRDDGRGLALAAWAALITLFFSFSSSKLVTYILPVFPQLALLGAAAGDPPRWARRCAAAGGAVLLLAALLTAPLVRLIPAGEMPAAAVPLATGAAALLGAGLLWWSRNPRPLLAGAAGGLLIGALGLIGMRVAVDTLSCRDLAAKISSRRAPADQIYTFRTYIHGLPFYTKSRTDRVLDWFGELEYADRDARLHEARFGDQSQIAALPLPDRRVFVVCRSGDAPVVLGLHPPGQALATRAFGRWTLIEY